MTWTATLPTRKPASRTRRAVSSSRAAPDAPAQAGSDVPKVPPRSPRPAADSSASHAAWALERRQFGRLLAEFQGLQWKFADMAVGAPPDEFNRAGQVWGIAGFHPKRLRAAGYEPFIQMIPKSIAFREFPVS